MKTISAIFKVSRSLLCLIAVQSSVRVKSHSAVVSCHSYIMRYAYQYGSNHFCNRMWLPFFRKTNNTSVKKLNSHCHQNLLVCYLCNPPDSIGWGLYTLGLFFLLLQHRLQSFTSQKYFIYYMTARFVWSVATVFKQLKASCFCSKMACVTIEILWHSKWGTL